MKQDFILEELQMDSRNGNLTRVCSACGREIELYEKVYDFGGEICKECFESVGDGLKSLKQSNA